MNGPATCFRPVRLLAFAALLSLSLSLAMSSSRVRAADFWERLGLKKAGSSEAAGALLSQALTDDQLIGGLREALGNGIGRALTELGRNDGFLTNLAVRIPMPDSLRKVERLARSAGQEALADEFVSSMNRAAEKAVPEAAAVFREAVTKMTIADAKAILDGPKDAATRFFEKTTRTNLQVRFQPLVQEATSRVGVTQRYKSLTSQIGALDSLGGGLFGNLRKSAVSIPDLDLDAYVTDKALDGLFHTVAEEEKRIRENPVARTTDLLQRVFGSARR
ncbi:MAG: DUF4197 domain-containing protein [Verrucomicrobiales bacterium]|nr:DUF4197 domain-containing protein [Verrucomicrobiales bacterium]